MEETNSRVFERQSAPPPKPNKVKHWLDRVFKLQENKTTIRTEVLAGVTTFFAMCYIVMVNPSSMTGTSSGPIFNAVFIASIFGAVIGTLLMAFLANMPFAQAAGMGLNSFFFSQFMLKAADKNWTDSQAYGAGLAIVFLSGAVFLLLSVTGLRRYIATALPGCLKKAIPAGIGLFIAFIGLQNSGLVVANEYTLVSIADFTQWRVFGDAGVITGGAAPVLAAILGIVLVVVLFKFRVKGAVAIGIIGTAVLYYLLTWTLPDFRIPVGVEAFKDFGKYAFRLDFATAFGATAGTVFLAVMQIITFCLVDMFDTVGTLYGTAAQAGMLDENGNPKNMNRCMMCDSVATAAGALLGTSTITTYVESATGVGEGGRTGLTSLVVAALFLVAMFFSPLAGMIPGAATSVALVFVGAMMLRSFKEVDLADMTVAIPSFLTLIVMPLTYSIANGIAVGVVTYVLIRLITLKYDWKQDLISTILAALFIVRFALITM